MSLGNKLMSLSNKLMALDNKLMHTSFIIKKKNSLTNIFLFLVKLLVIKSQIYLILKE